VSVATTAPADASSTWPRRGFYEVRFIAESFTGLSGANMDPQDLGIGRLFERIQDAVIVAVVRTQRIVLWNLAATNIFGYSASEALELRVEDLRW